MTKRTVLFMVGGALLTPLGAFLMIAVIPTEYSISETLSMVFDRIWARPVPMIAFAFWMLLFAMLGGLLARVGQRKIA